MKSKLFIGIGVAVVAIAATTVFAVNHFSPKSQLSDLNRANIEALTGVEDTGRSLLCWGSIEDENTSNRTHKTYCLQCEPRICTKWFDQSTCTKN
jgi:hypothetical protein